MRIGKQWKAEVAESLGSGTPLVEVDAHNIVPVWVASDKQEVGARTLRPKITRLLPNYLTEFPSDQLDKYPHPPEKMPRETDWAEALESLTVDHSVGKCDWCKPGEAAAFDMLERFTAKDNGPLRRYEKERNDPNVKAASELSPYFHFGQLAPQRAALRPGAREEP